MPIGVSALVGLANTTLASNVTTVTFSSISQAYRDLMLVSAVVGDGIDIRFNGSTSTYWNVYVTTQAGPTASASSSSSFNLGVGGTGTNQMSVVNIFDYTAATQKLILAELGVASNFNIFRMGRWDGTATVTSITITGTLNAGSTFALYGVSSV